MIECLTALWQEAGLEQVRTCQITVQRRFDSFDDYWNSAATSNTLRSMFDAMPTERRELLKAIVDYQKRERRYGRVLEEAAVSRTPAKIGA